MNLFNYLNIGIWACIYNVFESGGLESLSIQVFPSLSSLSQLPKMPVNKRSTKETSNDHEANIESSFTSCTFVHITA